MNRFESITLYDLMAEDFDVWVTHNAHYGYDLQIDDDRGQVVVDETGIDPCAMDSFAALCRQFLAFYDKAANRDN